MKSRARQRPGKIIFITGTDTGVGKTIFTGLLVAHLRAPVFTHSRRLLSIDS